MVAMPATSEKHDNSGDIACHACHHPSQLGSCKDWHILWTMRFSSFIIYTNSATRLTSCRFARPSLAAFLLHLVRSPESLLYDLTSTSVCYIPVDALCQTECGFSLPCSLQSFDFRGKVLFAPSSTFKLKNCDSLTKLGPSIMHTTFCYLVAYSTCRSISLLRMTTCGPTAVIGDAWVGVPISNVWLNLARVYDSSDETVGQVCQALMCCWVYLYIATVEYTYMARTHMLLVVTDKDLDSKYQIVLFKAAWTFVIGVFELTQWCVISLCLPAFQPNFSDHAGLVISCMKLHITSHSRLQDGGSRFAHGEVYLV